MKKIENKEIWYVRQRLPYYIPHLGWLETHAQQRAYHWYKLTWKKVINFVWSTEQTIPEKAEKILDWEKMIGYENENEIIIFMPDKEIVPNFPLPKFWKKEFWSRLRYIQKKYNPEIIVTRTRFFPSSFIWWVYAKKKKIKRIHIEHGSDYVSLSSKITSSIARIYDQILGRYVFKKADIVVPISKACQKFIKRFTKRKTEVIYRWIDIPKLEKTKILDLKNKYPNKIIMWYVWRLYKRKNLSSLIQAYYQLNENIKNQIQIVIVWDWEDYARLKKMDNKNKIIFLWWKRFKEALAIQSQFDVHLHTSSPGGGISSSLLQAMALWCDIIATPYEWADEVISNENGILLADDTIESVKKWIENYLKIAVNKKGEWKTINKNIIKEKFHRNANIKKYEKIIK